MKRCQRFALKNQNLKKSLVGVLVGRSLDVDDKPLLVEDYLLMQETPKQLEKPGGPRS